MAKRSKELPIPEPAMRDDDAIELARIWSANGTQAVSLRVGLPDAAAWGLTLADLARHVASAYEAKRNLDPRETLLQIRDAFVEEMTDLTDRPTGVVVSAPRGRMRLGSRATPAGGTRRSSTRVPTKLR